MDTIREGPPPFRQHLKLNGWITFLRLFFRIYATYHKFPHYNITIKQSIGVVNNEVCLLLKYQIMYFLSTSVHTNVHNVRSYDIPRFVANVLVTEFQGLTKIKYFLNALL